MYVNIFCECPRCGDSLRNLEGQFKTMKENEVKQVRCQYCGEEFEVEAGIIVEITLKRKPNNDEPF